jgi:hypothetical protein
MAVRLDTIIKELAVVNAKLADGPVSGARRLALLRRQATLGDIRDTARDAKRRALIDQR